MNEDQSTSSITKNKAIDLALEYVDRNNDLAPLPFFIHLIKAFMRDDVLDLRPLISAVENEEMISAKLIAFANSAYYGTLSTSTVTAAIYRLGEEKAKQVLLALSLGNTFDVNACPAFNLQQYWTDTLYRACSASFIADCVVPSNNSTIKPSEWYAITLVQNIGLRCLVQYEPKTMNTLFSADENLTAAEYETFGFSHSELSSALLSHWGLPDVFWCATPHINNRAYRGLHWQVAAVIDIARKQSADSPFDSECFESLAQEWGIPVSAEPVIASDDIDEALGLAKLIFDPPL